MTTNTAIAFTGMGIVSPLGNNPRNYYQRLMAGESPIEAVTLPGTPDGGSIWSSSVGPVELPQWCDEKFIDGTDVVTQWAVTAADQAIRRSDAEMNPLRTAVVHGTSLCGVQSVMRAQYEVDTHGPAAFPRKTMLRALTNMAAAQITLHYQLHGPSLTITTACASTLDAIGLAGRLIQAGQVDMAIVGATEAGENLTSGGMNGDFVPAMAYAPAAFGMQSPVSKPELACLPFDVRRNGVVGSEGSVFFVLERADQLSQRGGTALGYLRGYGSLADAFHPSAQDPSGQWEARTMALALQDAGMKAQQLDALIAHGTGTPKGDSAEIRAINSLHGDRDKPLPVASTKGHFGHAAAASGGMSLVAGLLGMAEQRFINTANTRQPDPEAKFDIVMEEPRDMHLETLQVNAFGFGGQNASLVVSLNPDS